MTGQSPPLHEPPWQAAVLTLFPDMFPGVLGQSLAGKASKPASGR